METSRSRTPPREEIYSLIYDAIRRVPRGSVVTYGQIAAMVGFPRHSRLVGRALRSLPDRSDVPWHRVVNAAGEVSRRTVGDSHELQRMLLEAEGVVFSQHHRISLDLFRWEDPEGEL